MRALKLTKSVHLPITIGSKRIFLTGMPESGKTYTAGKLAELMHEASIQFVWIDVVGVAWGLRKQADGKGRGIDIPIFGGLKEHSDIPISSTSGATMARLVVEKEIDAIFDLSLFDDDEQVQWWTDFARELLKLKARERSPIHIFIDEAQTFFPEEKGLNKAEQVMVKVGLKLWRVGRNFGIGGTLMSQAPQAVRKRAINLSEILIVHQIITKHERDAVEDWCEYASVPERVKQMVASLGSLEVGWAYIFSPKFLKVFKRVRILEKWTFDASATPDGKSKKRKLKPLTKLELADLRQEMKAEIDNAEANDVLALQAKVRALEGKLATDAEKWQEQVNKLSLDQLLGAQKATRVVPKKLPVLKKRELRRLEKLVSQVLDLQERSNATVRAIDSAVVKLDSSLQTALAIQSTTPELRTAADRKKWEKHTSLVTYIGSKPELLPPGDEPSKEGVVKLKKGCRAIIAALKTSPTYTRSRKQVALYCRIKPTGSTLSSYISVLNKGGYVSVSGNNLALTPKGQQLPIKVTVPKTPNEIIDSWGPALKKGCREILALLRLHAGTNLSREEIAARMEKPMDPKGSTITSYLSILRTSGLIEDNGDRVSLAPELFSP